jgi:hypothetical protein
MTKRRPGVNQTYIVFTGRSLLLLLLFFHLMAKLKSKLIPNERPSRNMMYKLKNNIVRVDASSKLIPNERPSRNKNEQTLRIPGI